MYLLSGNNNINDLSAAVIGGVFDSDGNICAENCTDDICQSVLISAAAASEYVSNTEAELHFVSEMVPKSAERQSSSRSTLRVPSATHTCTRANEYWRERVDDKVVADTDNITLDEVTEAPAIIRRGDILHLPMGRDDAADESTPIYGGVQQYAQSRWCQVLAVDILFARLWVRPSAAAPHCWLDDIEDESVGYRKVADSYWVPVSLLWDAVVFSPYHYSTSNFSRSALFTGFDVVKSAVHNGISILKCQYCAFNVPMLSSSEAIDMLRALGERYPNAAVIREISS